MQKIQIGDLFEISTPKGYAYFQYVYQKDADSVEMIKVLPGLFAVRPNFSELDILVSGKELFFIFFPVGAALRKKLISKVDHFSTYEFSPPKYMRSGYFIKDKFSWKLVDIETLKRTPIEVLTPEIINLSPFECWNDTMLIEKLTEGWTLEQWVR